MSGRWITALRAEGRKIENGLAAKPSKPPKPGFEGFEGAGSGGFAKIFELLDHSRWTEEDWSFAFEERAAILEFDHGLSRQEAEALALVQTNSQRLSRESGPVSISADATLATLDNGGRGQP